MSLPNISWFQFSASRIYLLGKPKWSQIRRYQPVILMKSRFLLTADWVRKSRMNSLWLRMLWECESASHTALLKVVKQVFMPVLF